MPKVALTPETTRAMATLQAALDDPVKLAAMNAELRSSVKGIHTLLVLLIERAGEPVRFTTAEVIEAQMTGKDIKVDRTEDAVTLTYLPPKVLGLVPKSKRRQR